MQSFLTLNLLPNEISFMLSKINTLGLMVGKMRALRLVKLKEYKYLEHIPCAGVL